MPEIICDTSPLQYLHQLGLLDLLHRLVGSVTVPQEVADEIDRGHALGINLPDVHSLTWITIKSPSQTHPAASGLDPGERDVLSLAMEVPAGGAVVIIDELPGRNVAGQLGLGLKGTLGLLLDAKRVGLLSAVKPQLDRLDALGFRLSKDTRKAVLRLAGELP